MSAFGRMSALRMCRTRTMSALGTLCKRTCAHTHTHTHTRVNSPQGWTRIFLHTLLLRADHQYLNGQHLACEVLTTVYVILTRSEFLFVYKMIPEIISVSRADSGYPHNFMVDSWVFKDGESESVAKTNSGPRVCPLLVKSLHFACVEHAQFPLLEHCVSTHTRMRAHTRVYFSVKLNNGFSFLFCKDVKILHSYEQSAYNIYLLTYTWCGYKFCAYTLVSCYGLHGTVTWYTHSSA